VGCGRPRPPFLEWTWPGWSRRSAKGGWDLITLTELIEAGKLAPVIDRTYPLAEAPHAIEYLEQGHARGKVVVTI
jgi:NADPH:quinone reductase-like Zn-dependent oxidoreductase